MAAAALGALAAIAVAAHTPAARPLLSRAFGGGCPLMASSPAERDAHRAAALAPLRGATRAPHRSALGLDLGRAGATEISAWAAQSRATCQEDERSNVVRCRQDDAELVLQLDAKGVLQAVDVLRDGTDVEAGAARLHRFAADLEASLGPPTATTGEPSAAFLGVAFQRADIRYRFQDYAVDLSATNFGNHALIVREQYRALPD